MTGPSGPFSEFSTYAFFELKHFFFGDWSQSVNLSKIKLPLCSLTQWLSNHYKLYAFFNTQAL